MDDDFFGDIFSQSETPRVSESTNAPTSTAKTNFSSFPAFLRGNGDEVDIDLDDDLLDWTSLRNKNNLDSKKASDEPENITDVAEINSFTRETGKKKVQFTTHTSDTTNQSGNLKIKDSSHRENCDILLLKLSDKENYSVSNDVTLLGNTRKRKFPGPAGLLPQFPANRTLIKKLSKLSATEAEVNSDSANHLESIEIPCSQIDESEFYQGPWLKALGDLQLDAFSKHSPLFKYNISWLLKHARSKQLPNNKMPMLIAVIKSINLYATNASTVLKDNSGEIEGTIECQSIDHCVSTLKAGTVLVLQHVHVYSRSKQKHYLIIKPINIACIYFSREDNSVGCQRFEKRDLNDHFTDIVKHSGAVAIENKVRSLSPINSVDTIQVQGLKTVIQAKSSPVNLKKMNCPNLNTPKKNVLDDVDWGEDDWSEILSSIDENQIN